MTKKTLTEVIEMELFNNPILAWASYATDEEIAAYLDQLDKAEKNEDD